MSDRDDHKVDRLDWSGPDEKLTREIIGAVIEVHRTLGTGFIESIYRNALVLELQHRGLLVEMEQEIDVYFKGELVGQQ